LAGRDDVVVGSETAVLDDDVVVAFETRPTDPQAEATAENAVARAPTRTLRRFTL
jgi:hypothetical protein